MIFLIEYDRGKGHIIKLNAFHESDRQLAEESRLNLELELNSKEIDHEVVLLEAESEEALRITHRRYFEDLSQLLKPPTPMDEPLLNSR